MGRKVLSILIFLIALMVFCNAIFGIVWPNKIVKLIHDSDKQKLYYSAIYVRAIIGIILMLGASATKLPLFVFWFGVIILASSLLLWIAGKARFQRILNWWIDRRVQMQRGGYCLALLLSATLMYASL